MADNTKRDPHALFAGRTLEDFVDSNTKATDQHAVHLDKLERRVRALEAQQPEPSEGDSFLWGIAGAGVVTGVTLLVHHLVDTNRSGGRYRLRRVETSAPASTT